jgi:SNF2 family DNA or RNA helicase
VTAGIYGELTADASHIILMATGDDWEIDRAAKALKRLTAAAEKTDPPGALKFPATWATVTQLGFTFNSDAVGRWTPMPRLRQWITAEFLRRCNPPNPFFTLPPGLTPRQYQIQGAAEISAAGKFLLFDDPGTGKTTTTILGLMARQQEHELFPMVIITPSWDVADVWTRHIRQWAPDWPEPSLYGGPDRTLFDLSGISVTTYATATLDAGNARGPLVKLKASAVIADESHFLKNTKAQRTSAVQRIAAHADTFVGLTGTPVTRDTGDIFPVLAAMDPRTYPSRERFVKRYLDTADNGYGETVEGLKVLAEPEFRAALAGQYRRVSKQDVLDQLPPKIYSVRRIGIPPQWRKSYDTMEQDMLAELPDGTDLPVMSVLAQLTRLGQLASSACDVAVTEELDVTTGELKKHYEVTLKAPSWKADALLGILGERPGQQTAVFANSKQLIMIAGAACEKAGYRCGYITGGQGKKERHDAIEKFQAGQLDVVLATAGAGGLGITLTRASTVVALQRSWQLDQAIQIEDRAHRLDDIVLTHDALEIIDVIAKDTVEDRVRELLRTKSSQLGHLVQDSRIVREILGGLK